jgi:Prokaryotic E2 family E
MPVPQRLALDVDAVRAQGRDVQITEDGTRFFVILNNFVLPDHYNPPITNLMVMADYQYPMSALDMFWTEPHVRCANGAWPQGGDQFVEFVGRVWQRWSWHYPGWNPSTHTLATHLEVCFDRLSKGC